MPVIVSPEACERGSIRATPVRADWMRYCSLNPAAMPRRVSSGQQRAMMPR
jgi:hypothetical protein